MNFIIKNCLASLFVFFTLTQLRAADPPHDLKYVHPDSVVSIFIHPQQAYKNPAIKDLVQKIQAEGPAVTTLPLMSVEEIKIVSPIRMQKFGDKEFPTPQQITITRTLQPKDADAILDQTTKGYEDRTEGNLKFKFQNPFATKLQLSEEQLKSLPEEAKKQIQASYEQMKSQGYIVTKLDDRTILNTYGSIDAVTSALDPKQDATSKPVWAEKFPAVAANPVVMAVNLTQVRQMVEATKQVMPLPKQGPQGMLFNAVSVLWEKSDYAMATLNTDNGLTLNATAYCKNEDDAKRINGMFEGIRMLAKGMLLPNLVAMAKQADETDPNKSGAKLIEELNKIFDQAKVTQKGSEVTLTMSASQATVEMAASTGFKFIQNSRTAARVSTNTNNMKQIALGMITYAEANKKFPSNDPRTNGQPPVSWRVKILPYIEEAALYKMYKMDEPWDSENNKKLIELMPAVFRHSNRDPKSTSSSYYTLTGNEGLHVPGKKISFAGIRDGTSMTALFVEAERDIPWTKPEDIEVVKGQVPKLGTKGSETFQAAAADGAIHKLSTKIDADTFWALFTINGREPISWPEDQPAPKPGAPNP